MKLRRLIDGLWISLFWGAGLLILIILVSILGYLLYKGGPALSFEFITGSPSGFPLGTEGGVYPAIKGTSCLVLIAILSSALPGFLTAIYLAEYAGQSKLKELFSITVQCMAGVPSIVTGLFAYALFVVHFGFGISLMAGGLALGIMIFPVIVVTSRDALLAVNNQFRTVGTSLGVSRWYILRRVIIPQAMPGILSGLLLAMGYAAGATAPIMVTAAVVSVGSTTSLFDPVMALPYHLYILFSHQISLENAYGTALLLVLILLAINVAAMWIRSLKGKGA
ncbi:phosphate ABC transporter permease PstA [Desulfofalx alkaliphila]|uniref:phosphate ABC transporter permease PstA n=1 Tax=Desulfofalx alkaliphila TaxID=105483 RepID=UPI0004E18827|nr:phosphate ABC transporter permease PstA [Desulfofalx alkaliphila]